MLLASHAAQAFVQSGDTTGLDQGLFARLLAAMAQGADAGASSTQPLLQQAQQQLQQLSADACQVLLEELLPAFDPVSSSSGSATQASDGAVQLTASALAHLLTHALLPKLQSLEAAAPKSLLASLTVLGEWPAGRSVLCEATTGGNAGCFALCWHCWMCTAYQHGMQLQIPPCMLCCLITQVAVIGPMWGVSCGLAQLLLLLLLL